MLTQQEATNVAHEIFHKWNEALHTCNSHTVAELYTDDATFLPTLSNEFDHGQKEAEGYFEHFLKKHPDGEIIDESIQVYSDIIVHSGFYDFHIEENNQKSDANARFTFVYQKIDGIWKIAHHHSSLKPTGH